MICDSKKANDGYYRLFNDIFFTQCMVLQIYEKMKIRVHERLNMYLLQESFANIGFWKFTF